MSYARRVAEATLQRKSPDSSDQEVLARKMVELLPQIDFRPNLSRFAPRVTRILKGLELEKPWHCLHFMFSGRVWKTDKAAIEPSVRETKIQSNLRMSKTCVLLADDNGQVLQYVSEFLSTNGCEVVAMVSDGQAALDAAMKLRPHVVVLDISMPILNGIQAARSLRQTDSGAKVVFLTVNKDPEICFAALETGALGYVLKPRIGADLIPAIEQARLGRRFVSPGCDREVAAQ